MKDQYVGDVNDYRKYGLLRIIQDVTNLKLGICWLKTSNDGRTDGEFRNYLQRPKDFRHFDPPLFDALSEKIKTKNDRTIKNILRSKILGNILSFDAITPDDKDGRKEFLRQSLDRLRNADIIFFDPDNGIEVKSVNYGEKSSSKYIYLHELEKFYSHDHSLVIYQHFPRAERKRFVKETVAKLRDRLNCSDVMAVSSSHVVFFLAGNEKHGLPFAKIKERIEKQWEDEFEVAIQSLGK